MTDAVNLSLTQKFICFLMVDGKKNIATEIFCSAGQQFLRSLPPTPSPVQQGITTQLNQRLRIAVGNVQPLLEPRRCKVAGTSYQVPAIVSEKRGSTLAVRWIIEAARKKKKISHKTFSHCLAEELLYAHEKQGRPRQRRDEYHKLSSGNRGYLRYRWW